MKNLLISFYFVAACQMACAQIPSAGNVLWLRADRAVFNNGSGTQAILGDLVQVWEDQSGNGNHFRQDVNSYRPQLVAQANVLCSQPAIRFDINRRTFLGSAMKLSGPKSIFIVFIEPPLAGNPQTLISLKGTAATYTEILCTDHPSYRPISYISEVPSSVSGGTTVNAVGNNVNFSAGGNIFSMTYDGGAISSPASYSSNYDTVSSAVVPSGLFGRLVGDTSTIGARAPEQNYSFLNGYIAEIIVYNRVLTAAETDQVENYLGGKYGFFGSCYVLAADALDFTTQLKNNAVQTEWSMNNETDVYEYTVEYSTDNYHWDSIAAIQTPVHIHKYHFTHKYPLQGINYYRIKIRYNGEKIKYSKTNMINFSRAGTAAYNIFPNPCHDFIYVQAAKKEAIFISILNSGGQLLKTIDTFSNTLANVKDLLPGLYFIRIKGRNAETIEKLIKN